MARSWISPLGQARPLHRPADHPGGRGHARAGAGGLSAGAGEIPGLGKRRRPPFFHLAGGTVSKQQEERGAALMRSDARRPVPGPGKRAGMLPSAESPLARLVLFMICLAIAGSFVAGVHYYGVERPQQEALRAAGLNPPSNFCMCRNLNCDPYGRGYCPPCHQGDNNCVCSCSDT
jgi:hypothetical protein